MNKIFIFAALVALCGVLNAAVDVVSFDESTELSISVPAKVLKIEVLSSVPTGTASVKAEKQLFNYEDLVVSAVYTNFTYVSISTNDVGLCTTNTTSFDQASFLPPAPFLQSYVTNVAYRTVSVTNAVPVVCSTITNSVGSTLTCVGGSASAAPSDAYLVPGDKVFFTGTARGRVTLVLER